MDYDEQQRADWVFAPETQSVSHARTQVARTLQGLHEESLDTVLLLTTELVTNAVRHGAGPVAVHLAWNEEHVRVAVEDHSAQQPVVREVDPEALGGRGLLLVDGLSSAWGVQPRGAGKSVWFTLDA